MHLRFARFFLLLSIALAAGCRDHPAKIVVSGKVLRKGQALTSSLPARAEVLFVPDEETVREIYPAVVQPDGTFTVPGREGAGIPPGSYRICVVQRRPYPYGTDLLRGRFDFAHSRIRREVHDPTEMIIDVAKPEG